MIVLFIKSDLIREQLMPGYPCPNCGRSGGMTMELRQRYAEFGTAKAYPKGVFGVVHCGHCGYTVPASRWTDDMHRAFVSLKTGYKTPRHYWQGAIRTGAGFAVGLVLLVGALSFMGGQQQADNDHRAALFASATQHPTPGVTLATITNGESTYRVWRVSRADAETVWLKPYAGTRQLTDIFTDKTWGVLPDSEFGSNAMGYSAPDLANNQGLRRMADATNGTKPYEAVVVSVLE